MSKLKSRTPELSNITRESPFGVPRKYFDDFYARLHTRLESEEGVLPMPRNRIVRLLKPTLAMAASFTLIFMLVYWPIKSFLPDYLAETNSYIDRSLEDETLISILDGLDEQSFFALLNETSVKQEMPDAGLNDEELMSYLSAQASGYEIFLQTEN